VADLLDPLDRGVRQRPLGGDPRRVGGVAALPGAEAELPQDGGRGAEAEVAAGLGPDAASDQEQRGRAVGQAAGLESKGSRRTGSAAGMPRSSPVVALMYEPPLTGTSVMGLPSAGS
jgi:hypothetical protein